MSVMTALVLVLFAAAPLHAQSTAASQGRVDDEGGSETRRVVLLDERLDFPGLAILDARSSEITDVESVGIVEVYREAMDLSRFAASIVPGELRDHFGETAAKG